MDTATNENFEEPIRPKDVRRRKRLKRFDPVCSFRGDDRLGSRIELLNWTLRMLTNGETEHHAR